MKRKIIFFLLAVFSLFAGDLDEVINKTVKRYENLKTFYAEFNQYYCDEVSGTCQNFTGRIYFSRPNYFRMEIDKPHQIYIGDSSSLWIYLPEKRRAIKQSLGQVPFSVNPELFLKDYEKHFSASFARKEATYEISLLPKDSNELYQKITVTIDPKNYNITAISIENEVGSESKYEFEHIELNKNIPRKIFRFQPPKGIKVDEY
ncbi:outer membrane lipoprotein carrier protein LolA [candidate division WOR-3 bacterium 4484_100]|uniref:Outer-membrane lipoprotein carrier protein n=1 Tax=candidate division WOR-3 bacterium 4484_100 TaxID=1936077 RepID=A0A1V4QHP4_UNCW3|nr:MAG: outer membrane lipoprotein carrier protein LolA [candidate division WOR-3 bacterium 4484_100]